MKYSSPALLSCPSPTGVRAWIVVALVAAVVIAYANSLHAPFVYDDLPAIRATRGVEQNGSWWKSLLPQSQGGLAVSGRPVLNLSFALNHAVSGEEVWSYHALNVAIHVGAALCLLGLIRRTLLLPTSSTRVQQAASPLALVITTLWAVHPLQTQAVTYTVQRAESLMGCCYLFTMYALVRAATATDSRARATWQFLCVVACLLGMGTKEVMVTAPVLALLYDRTFLSGSLREALRLRRGLYVALASTWIVLAVLVWSTGANRGGTVGIGVGVPWWAYALTQPQAIAQYLRLSVWPHPLIFEYGTFWARRFSDVAPHAAIVLPLLLATAIACWRWPKAGFLGAWFFLILSPTSLTPGTIQMIVEHRMYLPLAAVLSGIVMLAHAWLRTAANVIAPIAVLACLAATIARNQDYRSALALWSDTVAKRPANPRAHDGMAEALVASGQPAAAVEHYKEATRLLPDESIYHYNLAVTLTKVGRLKDAVQSYEDALRFTPNLAPAQNNLAVLLVQTGHAAEALPHHAEAVRLAPTDATLQVNYGNAFVLLGRYGDALRCFQQAAALEPGNPDTLVNLGSTLLQMGRVDEARVQLAQAVRLQSGNADTRVAQAIALLAADRAEEAAEQFTIARKLDPKNWRAMLGMAEAQMRMGSPQSAASFYEEALRAKPDSAEAHYGLANLLMAQGQFATAIGHYEAALRISPQDAEAHHNLGIAYVRSERLRDAEREFETALRLRPDYAEARQHLVQLRTMAPP